MSRIRTKTARFIVSLNSLQVDLLTQYMADNAIAIGEEVTVLGRVLADNARCRAEHSNKSKVPVGRPKKTELSEYEELEKAQAALGVVEDTLSFSDEELAKLQKKSS